MNVYSFISPQSAVQKWDEEKSEWKVREKILHSDMWRNIRER